MSTPAGAQPQPDWGKLCEALFPHLSLDERAALTKIWEGNYSRFEPLKSRLDATIDPDVAFDAQP
jgi:hypothetical protein